MKPSAMQLFFAEDWPARIWITAWISAATIGLVKTVPFNAEAFRSLSFVATFVFLFLVVALIAYLVSIILGCIVLPPIFRWRERLNGAPYKVGETVEILCRPHRGTLGEITTVGDDRYGLWVKFEGSAQKSTHNFPYTAICRIPQF